MPYIPYLPYIPNIPYFPNMPYQTDHTHHTYPTYHTTPPPHHRGGGRSHMGPVYGTHPMWGGGEGGGGRAWCIYIVYIYILYIYFLGGISHDVAFTWPDWTDTCSCHCWCPKSSSTGCYGRDLSFLSRGSGEAEPLGRQRWSNNIQNIKLPVVDMSSSNWLYNMWNWWVYHEL